MSWYTLFKSAQFRKTADTVVIDGKPYQEGDELDRRGEHLLIMEVHTKADGGASVTAINNNGQEITFHTAPTPVAPPTVPTQVDFPAFHMSVVEGGKGHNMRGNYIVQQILPDKKRMIVRYTDGTFVGTEQELDIFGQVKHMWREIREHAEGLGIPPMNLTGDRESFTIGYLAQNGKIIAMVPASHLEDFKRKYERLTGDRLDPYLADGKGCFYIREKSSAGYLRIVFDEPSHQVLQNMTLEQNGIIPIRPPTARAQNSHQLQFNSAPFVWNLFALGFHIGRNNDRIAQIRQNVANTDAFNQGTQYHALIQELEAN